MVPKLQVFIIAEHQVQRARVSPFIIYLDLNVRDSMMHTGVWSSSVPFS